MTDLEKMLELRKIMGQAENLSRTGAMTREQFEILRRSVRDLFPDHPEMGESLMRHARPEWIGLDRILAETEPDLPV